MDAGAPLSCGNYAFCEDFESYPGGPITNKEVLGPWIASVSNLTILVDSVNPHTGTKSLHITSPDPVSDAGNAASGVLEQSRKPSADAGDSGLVAGNDLFGRAYVFYATTADAGLAL